MDELNPELNPVDVQVGKKVRERRQKLGWTLMDLAERLGVSHQQVQKYEQGTTRISASSLYQISKIFQTNQDYFFSALDKASTPSSADNNVDLISFANKESPINVLLIEDDASDEIILRKALEKFEVPVSLNVIHDGDEAMRFLKSYDTEFNVERPDLIILDLNIPKRNGHAVLKEVKRDRKLHDIPIIILTNSLSKREMLNVYVNGGAGYICKSFDFEQFKKDLKNAINYWANTAVLPNRC